MALQDVPVELVELVQSRVQLDMLVIQEYAEAMGGGDDFPPVRILAEDE